MSHEKTEITKEEATLVMIESLQSKFQKLSGTFQANKAHEILSKLDVNDEDFNDNLQILNDIAPKLKKGTMASAQIVKEIQAIIKLIDRQPVVDELIGGAPLSEGSPAKKEKPAKKGNPAKKEDTETPVKKEDTETPAKTVEVVEDDIDIKTFSGEQVLVTEEFLSKYDEDVNDLLQEGDIVYVTDAGEITAIISTEEFLSMLDEHKETGLTPGDVVVFDTTFMPTPK